jgi:hypothetical protein
VSKDQDDSEAIRRKLRALVTGPSDLEWKTAPLDGGATVEPTSVLTAAGFGAHLPRRPDA